MYKVMDKDGRVINSSQDYDDILEILAVCLQEDQTKGKPSNYIVASVEDPAERDKLESR